MHRLRRFISGFRNPLYRRRFLLFAAASVVTTVGGWIIIHFLTILGWSVDVANIVQAIWSISVAFYLNNRYAWGDRKWIPTLVKAKLYAISKVVTVSFNAIVFRLLLVIAPFVLVWILSRFSSSAIDEFLIHNDEYSQLFAYLGSTAVIMIVNWLLYDNSVFATTYLKELKTDHPRIYRWIVSRYLIKI